VPDRSFVVVGSYQLVENSVLGLVAELAAAGLVVVVLDRLP
jgi:hypothetical protein